jgi:SAM-dependent methyltransferase
MRRIDAPEILDSECSCDEVRSALRTIGRVNRWFGGVAASQKMIERIARDTGRTQISMLEVACGSGEVSGIIQKNLARRGITLEVTLLDLAQSHLPGGNRRVVGDGLALPFSDGAFDLASCNLFAHHLKPHQLQQFVREALRVSRLALLINDLVRGRLHLALAYAGYPIMPSRIAWLDGLTSVRRSYSPQEMREMILAAVASERVPEMEISRHYLYRMGVTVWKNRETIKTVTV